MTNFYSTYRNFLKANYLGFFILIVHISGMVGMMSSFRTEFIKLTPVSLLFSFIALIIFHEKKNFKFIFYTLFIVVCGFFIEMIGVNTGFPFGAYSYDWALGWKWIGTPFIIGINWFIMTYTGVLVADLFKINTVLKALMTGLIVMTLDIIIETVAIHSYYWTWADPQVPVMNFISWFVFISLFAFLILKLEKERENKLGFWVLGSQILFFSVLFIYYKI